MSLSQPDVDTSIIYAALSVNSTTLYTYDNLDITSRLSVNYSELISKNLGEINSTQDSRVNNYQVSNNIVMNNATAASGPAGQNKYVNLMIYYNKRLMKNNDLITIVILCNDRILSNFVLNLVEKLMDYYLSDYYNSSDSAANYEFKIKMKEMINSEEEKLRQLSAKYESVSTNELEELRELMNENIDKILNRGENLNNLINKTNNLNTSSNAFRRRTVMIKRKFWWSNVRFFVMVTGIVVMLIYLLIGLECGLPFYRKCLHPSKPTQPPKHPPSFLENPEQPGFMLISNDAQHDPTDTVN